MIAGRALAAQKVHGKRTHTRQGFCVVPLRATPIARHSRMPALHLQPASP
jgi:hypothetical protein